MNAIISVENLVKSYRDTVAVKGVSFQVGEGEIFGMVGPNGAGKTTTIECIEGLRQPDSGRLQVLGLDPLRQERQLRPQVGIQLQQAQLPDNLKVWEAMDLYASFYQHTVGWEELLADLGLEEKRGAAFRKLSGGQKQRLFIALALLNDPRLVFLDELTTGLDPHARRAIWDLVREVRGRGKTVFLTTHYMEEAESLCDRVAILDGGEIVALDTPANLIKGLGISERIHFRVQGQASTASLEGLPGVKKVEKQGDQVVVYGRGNGALGSPSIVAAVVNALSETGLDFSDLRTESPDLEDVFLTLTGRPLGQEKELLK
jgi:ABC-2 type transport system ATP-binding protein